MVINVDTVMAGGAVDICSVSGIWSSGRPDPPVRCVCFMSNRTRIYFMSGTGQKTRISKTPPHLMNPRLQFNRIYIILNVLNWPGRTIGRDLEILTLEPVCGPLGANPVAVRGAKEEKKCLN